METSNSNREQLLIELTRVLGAMLDTATASMKPEVVRAMHGALQSGRGRIGWLIETNPLNADCLFMTGDKLVPLFVIRADAVDTQSPAVN